MHKEGFYSEKLTSGNEENIQKINLASKIEQCFFSELRLTDAVEYANSPNALGTIEADLYFNLVNSDKQTIYNGISLNEDRINFDAIARRKIEEKISSLKDEKYKIYSLLYEYKIPKKNNTTGEKYIVISRRNLPIS